MLTRAAHSALPGAKEYHGAEAVARQRHRVALDGRRHKVEHLGVHVQRRECAGGDDDALEAVKDRLDRQRRIQAAEANHRTRTFAFSTDPPWPWKRF